MNFSALNSRFSRIFSSLSRSANTVPDFGVHRGFQPQPLVIRHLAGRAGQAPDELGHFQRLAPDLHPARLQPDQVEQVVDQLEQPHAVGVHRRQQVSASPGPATG